MQRTKSLQPKNTIRIWVFVFLHYTQCPNYTRLISCVFVVGLYDLYSKLLLGVCCSAELSALASGETFVHDFNFCRLLLFV